MKTLLLSFAHPDDESFSTGILAAKYSANGYKIHLLTASYGEAGQTGPYGEISGDALGNIRAKELSEAAKTLGISTVFHLGYRDGTLKNQTDGELEDKIYRKMVEYTPDAVVTYDPTGISNHPDHMKMCFATTYAFQRYTLELEETRTTVGRINQGDKTVKIRNFASHHKFALKQKSFAEVMESDIEPKLYYVALPESTAKFLKKSKVLPDNSFDKPVTGTPDKFITTVIEGVKFQTKKVQALCCHKSQYEDVERFVGFAENPLLFQEYYILRMQGSTEVFMGKNDRITDRL
jgi:LmbE family N-acetylglucosaminyl deacetylase